MSLEWLEELYEACVDEGTLCFVVALAIDFIFKLSRLRSILLTTCIFPEIFNRYNLLEKIASFGFSVGTIVALLT